MLEWIQVTRIWALTASFVPIVFGACLSWAQGRGDAFLFVLTLVAGMLLQAGVNLNNTYDDYMNGKDQLKCTYGFVPSPLVRGTISPISLRIVGLIAFALSVLIGLYLSWTCGWQILLFGILGVVGGYCYTGSSWPYKYHGLGLVFVFFLMGPLMSVPTYFIQCGEFSWLPVVACWPISFVVTAIMHANDIRDVEDDRRSNVHTWAAYLGRRWSIRLYALMWIGAYLSQFYAIYVGALSYITLITLVLLPVLAKMASVYGQDDVSKEDLLQMVRISAKLHFIHGLLLSAGTLLLLAWPLAHMTL